VRRAALLFLALFLFLKVLLDLPAALMHCLYKSFYFLHSLHKIVRLYAAWFYSKRMRKSAESGTSLSRSVSVSLSKRFDFITREKTVDYLIENSS